MKKCARCDDMASSVSLMLLARTDRVID
jgi:hypothetical protein